jgi:hypothetical protein
MSSTSAFSSWIKLGSVTKVGEKSLKELTLLYEQ